MKNPWKQLSSKTVYENKYFTVREDEVVRPDGSTSGYFVIDLPQSVMIVALTSDNEVYMVGQHRYTNGLYSWEIPGGSTEGQDILESAKRELQEETGLVSNDWENLGINQVLNGSTNKIFHILLAKNTTQTNENKQLEEGINKMEKIPFKKVLEMISSGEITDSETISSLTLAGIKLGLISGDSNTEG